MYIHIVSQFVMKRAYTITGVYYTRSVQRPAMYDETPSQ
jgi:hypothetical protein